jgi:uncharacterized membrane protein YtjA (UPF0391 family)
MRMARPAKGRLNSGLREKKACASRGTVVAEMTARTLHATVGQTARNVSSNRGEKNMLQAAAVFFIIAIIAAVFGFGGIAAGATEIAKILFFIFLIVFVVSLIMGLMRR